MAFDVSISKFSLMALGAFILAFGAGLLFFTPPRSASASDDAYHTTVAYFTTHNYGDGAVACALASIDSTDTSDTKATIVIYPTPYGGSEYEDSSSTQDRDFNGLWQEVTIPVDDYASGTTFRIVYTTYDSGGTPQFTNTRTLTKP